MAAARTSNEAIQENMTRGFTEVKEMLLRYEERLRAIETREAGCAPIMTQRVNAAWARIDQHSLEIKHLSEWINNMSKTALILETVAKWLLGVLTAIIVAILIGILTGKIMITFQ